MPRSTFDLVGSKRIYLVDALAILFGIASWISINGLWVEVPLLVESLPEGWKLPSYLAVVVQVANIGPVAYGIAKSFRPNQVNETYIIYGVLIIGAIASLCLATIWEKTAIVLGNPHSVALIVLTFFLATVDCSSSVLFMPFMAVFQKTYLTSYLIGEALSGFIPSVAALAQGIGGGPACMNETSGGNVTFKKAVYPPPRFSIDAFFYFLLGMMALSTAAFTMLNVLPSAKKARIQKDAAAATVQADPKTSPPENPSDSLLHSTTLHRKYSCESINNPHTSKGSMSGPMFAYLLFLQAWICTCKNGVFTSIQTYSTLPYGNLVFHLSVALSSMASPIVCCLAFFLSTTNVHVVTTLTGLGTIVAGYIMALAVMSPTPPMMDSATGQALVILAWILFSSLFTYAKLCIATLCRIRGHQALFYCGAITQLGSSIGAFVMFFVINFTNTFRSFSPCL